MEIDHKPLQLTRKIAKMPPRIQRLRFSKRYKCSGEESDNSRCIITGTHSRPNQADVSLIEDAILLAIQATKSLPALKKQSATDQGTTNISYKS